MMEGMDLQQHADFTTHKLGNILDLVFTEVTGKLKVTKCTSGPFLNNHQTVECQLSFMKNKPNLRRYHTENLTISTSTLR